MELDKDKIEKAVVQQIVDELIGNQEDFDEIIRKEAACRVDTLFRESAEAQIRKVVDDAIKAGLDHEYQRINTWGEKVGSKTTIKAELEKITKDYWGQSVDKTSGKPSTSYGAITRAEYVMGVVCSDSFSETMKTHITNAAGGLKDGIRSQLGIKLDDILSQIFRVNSLQDQGKADKPW